MVSCIVVHKNSLRQQTLEEQAAKGTEKTGAVSA